MKADTAVIILAGKSVIQLSTEFSLNRSCHKKEIVSMTLLCLYLNITSNPYCHRGQKMSTSCKHSILILHPFSFLFRLFLVNPRGILTVQNLCIVCQKDSRMIISQTESLHRVLLYITGLDKLIN